MDIGFMDFPDDVGTLYVHEFRAATGFQSASLQHSAHGTVEYMDH
jgi:hypothetical protein